MKKNYRFYIYIDNNITYIGKLTWRANVRYMENLEVEITARRIGT